MTNYFPLLYFPKKISGDLTEFNEHEAKIDVNNELSEHCTVFWFTRFNNLESGYNPVIETVHIFCSKNIKYRLFLYTKCLIFIKYPDINHLQKNKYFENTSNFSENAESFIERFSWKEKVLEIKDLVDIKSQFLPFPLCLLDIILSFLKYL